MNSIGTEVGQKMRSAIKAKLMELGCYVDDELPDYIMVMVANKRSRSQMEDDLQLFLRSDTEVFVEWLQQVLKKLKEVTITNPDVCGSFRELKRKAAMEIAECVIKKEKKDKKVKTEKKTRNVEIIPQVKSITDEIPVQAIKLVEKRNQAIRSKEKAESKGETSKDNAKSTKLIQIVNEDNFDIPSLAEVNELEDSQLDIVENKIKEARNRLVLMKSDSEDDDFINLRADAEELMGDEIDGSNISNAESLPVNDKRIVTLSKEESDIPFSPKRLGMKASLAERLGARPDNSSTSSQSSKLREKTTRISLSKAIREEQQLSSRIRSSIQSIIKKPNENKIRKKESVHKRLGLPSSVVSLPKKNDDGDNEVQSKSMMSVVQVKPRRNVSGICQANKNLLLKAVAEAQKSVTQTPLVGNEVKNKKSYLLKRREQQKIDNNNKIIKNNIKKSIKKDEDDSIVQNIIIEVKSKKSQSDTDESESDVNNDIYVPTSVAKDTDSSAEENDYVPSAIDLTYEEDLDKLMEDFEEVNEPENLDESEKEEPKTNHQFIVTLDGLKDKKILKSTENNEIEEPAKPVVKRAPSPIIFDKKDVPKSEKTVPQVPERLPKVHLPLSVKTKERCKYWPNCRLKEACEYVHPNTQCNVFPLCKFGEKCLYIHPKCKFDASCTRKDCPYSHGTIKVPIKPVVRPVASYGVSQEVCKYHPNCSNPHCHFYHPKPCRFGKYCINKSECSFSHGKIPNKDKLTWHSNAR